MRAVWVHLFDDTLRTPASIDRMVDRVADANTLVVEGVRRNTAAASLAHLERLTAGTDGVALYSFQETAEAEPFEVLFDRLPRGVWSEPAAVPDTLRR